MAKGSNGRSNKEAKKPKKDKAKEKAAKDLKASITIAGKKMN